MANFAVAASAETIEFATKVMDMYAQEGEKKEDTLLRILNLAEKESVKGTHPELEDSLKTVDTTITTLIKQINGIVGGQDLQLTDLKKKLDEAIEEKRAALEMANVQMDAATARMEAAEAAIKQAAADKEMAQTQAQAEIDVVKKDASIEIERANSERNQAIRERDDARTISIEKTSSNDLLMRQMSNMEADVQAYKELQKKYDQLSAEHASLESQLSEKERELDTVRKDAETAKKAMEADFSGRMETAKAQQELAVEKAVIAKEREIRSEYQKQIREADKESARLSARIEQLEKIIAQANGETKKN